jgi:hypothetical protein
VSLFPQPTTLSPHTRTRGDCRKMIHRREHPGSFASLINLHRRSARRVGEVHELRGCCILDASALVRCVSQAQTGIFTSPLPMRHILSGRLIQPKSQQRYNHTAKQAAPQVAESLTPTSSFGRLAAVAINGVLRTRCKPVSPG